MICSFLAYVYSPTLGLEEVVRLLVFVPITPKMVMMTRAIMIISIRRIIIRYDGLGKWVLELSCWIALWYGYRSYMGVILPVQIKWWYFGNYQ